MFKRISLPLLVALMAGACLLPVAAPQPTPTAPAPASPTTAPLTATTPPTATEPPPTPTEVPPTQVLTSIRIAVLTADNQVMVVDTHIGLDPENRPAATKFPPPGGVAGDMLYLACDYCPDWTLFSVDVDEAAAGAVQAPDSLTQLSPTHGLAVWPGNAADEARLAWGAFAYVGDGENQIVVSAPGSTEGETVLSEPFPWDEYIGWAVQGWSADGQAVYFSREPTGTPSSFPPFIGASSLFRLNLADKQVTELVPYINFKFFCVHSMSPDERLVGTCDGVLDLSTGQTTPFTPPAEAAEAEGMGGAYFSPDSSRLTFTVFKGDAAARQVWVAMADSQGGEATVVVAGAPGQAIGTRAWLNADTLLLQSVNFPCTEQQCTRELWTVNTDGSNMLKVADGSFLAVVDGPQP